jgi:DNA-binding NtrC family response regulator
MDLRLQVEELRRRLDQGAGPVQIIEVAEPIRPSVLEMEEVPDRVVYQSGMTMAEVEKAAIAAALTEHRGNRRLAAQMLGIGERTLYRKIKEYGLD